MTPLNNIKDNWFDFGMSYLYLAHLSCEEMTKEGEVQYYAEDLFIATIFNIKHGIEVNLKSLIVLLEEKQISKKLEHHNQEEILKELYKLINEKRIISLIKRLIEKYKNDDSWIFKEKKESDIIPKISKMMNLVSKYHRCDFLKDKIGQDFVIEDIKNDAFRYPQNNLSIKLDYRKIIEKLNKLDKMRITNDVLQLINYFLTLHLLFDECIKEKTSKSRMLRFGS